MGDSANMDSNTSKRATEYVENRSPKKFKAGPEEELNFVKLFEEAREILQEKMNLSVEDVERGIKTVIEAFHYHKGSQFSDIDLSKSENLYGFFYRHFLLSAGLTNDKILNAINNCEKFRRYLQKSRLKIASLGSGPGSDIVGLCSALDGNMTCSDVKFTLVDLAKRFASFFNIIEFLLREGNFGKASNVFQKVNICTSFVCEDVCRGMTRNNAYRRVLKEADIILVKNLLSSLSFADKNMAIQNIVREMKVGALVLVIDSRFPEFEGLETIYSSTTNSFSSYIVNAKPKEMIGRGISDNSSAQIQVMIKEKE